MICDDVSYEDEPYFQDGIIARAVNDVAAAGISYFSSAGNDLGINSYASDFRPVPNGTGLTAAAGNSALAGTNINLANVPTNLYAGGFHNFNPSGGLDVAQTVNIPNNNGTPLAFEWDDPTISRCRTRSPLIRRRSTATPVTFLLLLRVLPSMTCQP